MKKLLVCLLILFLCASAAMAETTMYLAVGPEDTHVLWAEPDKESEALGQYYPGTPVTVLEEESYWRRVRIGDQVGWLVINYLSDTPTLMFGPVATVVNEESDWVNLREGATTKSASLARVEEYEQVLVLGETADGWSCVDWRGKRGFMLTSFLQKQGSAHAAVVGRTGDDYIHQYTADNGQTIFFVSMLQEPTVAYQDVNFDGRKDIVVCTARGATNYFVEFFVWGEGQYVLARHPDVDGLVNYYVHPESGIVSTHASHGGAGGLHDICLFRWAGTNLEIIRRAVSRELEVFEMNGDTFTNTTYTNILDVKVHDYTTGESGGTVLWERTIPVGEDAYRDFYTEEIEALWQGLK